MFYTLYVMVLVVGSLALQRGEMSKEQPGDTDTADTLVTFQQHIAPLLKTNCSPCHFDGGQVFGRYPFDDYSTVKELGEKLNTRLKEQEQKTLVVDWLKSGAREK